MCRGFYEHSLDKQREVHQTAWKSIYHNHVHYPMCTIYVSSRALQDEELQFLPQLHADALKNTDLH